MALPPLIPRRVLFGNLQVQAAAVSPDGTRLAYLAPEDGVMNAWVRPLSGGPAVAVTRDRNRGIAAVQWARTGDALLYTQDQNGDENHRLYIVDLATHTVRCLTPFDNIQVQLLAYRRQTPGTVLIAMNRDNPKVHDAYAVDLPGGELRLLARNPGRIIRWFDDARGEIRAALAATSTGGWDLLWRDAADADWRTLLTWEGDDSFTSGPAMITSDGRGLYLLDSRHGDTTRLTLLDAASGDMRVLAESPDSDIREAMTDADERRIVAAIHGRGRDEWIWLDDAMAADFAALRGLHDGEPRLVSRDDQDRIWIVKFIPEAGPAAYYQYDRATKRGALLFENMPELKEYRLARRAAVEIQSRDGLRLPCYLTLPDGEPGRNLPLVLNVHGGPWHRDSWGHDTVAQWLANRGYACLQVNFRGSTGFGKRFLNAANHEWGRAMQHDLTDAVRWAIAQGVADPERVAIFGGSYGGYAALAGVTFTPELYRCAVDIVGPSNLLTFIETIPPYWKPMLDMFRLRVGDPERDAAMLRERSPLFHVDAIRCPLLIAQGANDPRVKQSESEQIVAALRAKGVPHEYLLFPDEGHGFVKPENRLRFFAAAERFLAEHLGGRHET